MISWLRRNRSSVSLKTAKAEYIATCSASCEAIWLWKLLSFLFDMEMDMTMIICDNQRFMKMTKNPMFYDKTNHLEIWYFYICVD